ncbi:MAG: cupin [Flaviflexus sp.]|uniref:cupin n=1 Tax=Flaviflexus sp. TaxID=1969482 RepID=UPI00352E65EC
MDVLARVDEALEVARRSDHGRHAELLVSDGPLRQSLITLIEGVELPAHNSPPAASILVLRGEIEIIGTEPDLLTQGALKALTHVRHGVVAKRDSAFLLTTVTGIVGTDSHDERKL